MPYIFAFLLLMNIGAFGYFVFVHDEYTDSPNVVHDKAQIDNPVKIRSSNQSQ